ncbi:hypothetical protein THASP1DRAFT_28164 [Thamnocephalis sphaerospora]|uniref:F-box domain-containing protein n=1 Tax=Thamnocephalis sphaerospora TaxID=78915 RepID=A0A4P9XUY6_9FUNG|nr:hypothetical protein THASP1DRAFT_28164 [Thamnocephalis sphaerospora]|eukprot:RKP10048.1 hypothetical protein THASP1DRAFT_28164 [Thamnocephalis sphaerospora]
MPDRLARRTATPPPPSPPPLRRWLRRQCWRPKRLLRLEDYAARELLALLTTETSTPLSASGSLSRACRQRASSRSLTAAFPNARSAQRGTTAPAILRLPVELVLAFMRLLPPEDVFALERTCHRLHCVLADNAEMRYATMYRWRFAAWRSEHALLQYWRKQFGLSQWRDLYERRARLETRWRNGDWRLLTAQLPGYDSLGAHALLVSVGVGVMAAVRAGGAMARIALESASVHATPPLSGDVGVTMRVMTSHDTRSATELLPAVEETAGRPVELRANEHLAMTVTHTDQAGMASVVMLWCARTMRFLGSLSIGAANCRLIGRRILKIVPFTGEAAVYELNPSTSAGLPQLTERPMPHLGWRWDVLAAHPLQQDRWLLAGGNEANRPAMSRWAIVDLARPSFNVVCKGAIQFNATTVHVLDVQLNGQTIMLTGSAGAHVSEAPHQHTGQDSLDASLAPNGKANVDRLDDLLCMSRQDSGATDLEEKTDSLWATQYRWLYVRAIDGSYRWARRFVLGHVRAVHLHADLDRVYVHTTMQQLRLFRARDGVMLGCIDFFGGAHLYHVLGSLWLSVDPGHGFDCRGSAAAGCSRRCLRTGTYTEEEGVAGQPPNASALAKHHALRERLAHPPTNELGVQRLVLYDMARACLVGVFPLPRDQRLAIGGTLPFAVNPAQFAFRDGSGIAASLTFDYE